MTRFPAEFIFPGELFLCVFERVRGPGVVAYFRHGYAAVQE